MQCSVNEVPTRELWRGRGVGEEEGEEGSRGGETIVERDLLKPESGEGDGGGVVGGQPGG